MDERTIISRIAKQTGYTTGDVATILQGLAEIVLADTAAGVDSLVPELVRTRVEHYKGQWRIRLVALRGLVDAAGQDLELPGTNDSA